MSNKKLILSLLLVAITISSVAPTTVFGLTQDFKPRNETRWTASIQSGTNSAFIDGDIYVGLTERAWPDDDLSFRAYATFDINGLPSNACISEVRLDVDCFLPSLASHSVGILKLTNYPVSGSVTSILDDIINAPAYMWVHGAMSNFGASSIVLPADVNPDLESAAQGSGLHWFALGFMEAGMDDPTAIWKGKAYGLPILHVTYTVPVQSAPAPTIAEDSICTDVEFCVNWPAVSGATSYEIQETGGSWIAIGANRYRCYTKSVAGEYSFNVRAANSCGTGPASQPVTIEVVPGLAKPAAVWALNSTYCINSNFTVHWNTVAGADSYEVRADNGSWVNTGTTVWKSFSFPTAGQRSFSARAIGTCGKGPIQTSSVVTIQVLPSTPAPPTTTNATPCPNQDITIRWSAVAGVSQYRLIDSITGTWAYVGSGTSWTSPQSAGSNQYRLQVFNTCGWSNVSGPLSIITKEMPTAPGAPVSNPDPAIIGQPYTISWNAVDGATYYELYELWTSGSRVLVYSGSEIQAQIGKASPGDFVYSVKACGECGCSDEGSGLDLTVGIPSSVEEIDAAALPNSYALDQNYPNPFNPETRIEFSLRRAGHVELTVYNILGANIRTLVSDHLSAGYKAVSWDGRDDSGRQVSSGVYLYRLTAGEFTETKKMMLVK